MRFIVLTSGSIPGDGSVGFDGGGTLMYRLALLAQSSSFIYLSFRIFHSSNRFTSFVNGLVGAGTI